MDLLLYEMIDDRICSISDRYIKECEERDIPLGVAYKLLLGDTIDNILGYLIHKINEEKEENYVTAEDQANLKNFLCQAEERKNNVGNDEDTSEKKEATDENSLEAQIAKVKKTLSLIDEDIAWTHRWISNTCDVEKYTPVLDGILKKKDEAIEWLKQAMEYLAKENQEKQENTNNND